MAHHPATMLSTQSAAPASNRLVQWLGWCVAAAVILVALAAIHGAFLADPQKTGQGMFTQFQQRATILGNETDPIKRDSMCIPLSAFGRSVDAQIPTNARVFMAGMLGPENAGGLGYYFFLTDYLFPREVSISLGQPPTYNLAGVAQGRNPASLDELSNAGYDLVLQLTPDGHVESKVLKPLGKPPGPPPPIPGSDEPIAFFLPLAVALAGTRLVRWLFKELDLVLSLGELLACGLALGAFFLTQGILALRLAGLRLEQILGVAVMIWAVVEIVLLFRQRRGQLPQFHARQLWWLLLAPAGLMLWALFRLAGKEGLLEFDAVAFWAFKAKILYLCAGPELLAWFKNPTLSYAHMDYPLLATLLHTFTYGVLGHVDEFVTKFWNQWMLLFLGWSILGAGKFPKQKPWLAVAVVTVVILLPMTLDFARKEGGTIPMVFFMATSSLQLAIGMVEKQPSRIRLGLLVLMAAAMVKFEGIILFGFWCILLLLDKDSRAALWPLRRIGLAGLLGLAGWLPYFILRLLGTAPNTESDWPKQLIHNTGTVLHILPMHLLAFLSRRFFNGDFAAWGAPDNQHAVWQGKWLGAESFVDQATLGMGWACLLLLILACLRGGKLRWTELRLFLVFVGFATFICIVWSSARSNPLDYTTSLAGSETITGGRYLYPAFMSWFVAGFVLLIRAKPEQPAPAVPVVESEKPRKSKSKRRAD
jgi:hypothetical protein